MICQSRESNSCSKFSQECILDFAIVMVAEFRVSAYREYKDDSILFLAMLCWLISLLEWHFSPGSTNGLIFCHYSAHRVVSVSISEYLSFHNTSACAVHSRVPWNKDHTLSANAVLHLFHQGFSQYSVGSSRLTHLCRPWWLFKT